MTISLLQNSNCNPYLDGVDNMKKAFNSNQLALADRVKHFFIGFCLFIPIVNCAIYYYTENNSVYFDPLNQANHIGAGVIPYCIKDGHTYFLLSKEGYYVDKNTWCDFGGSKDRGETAVQTAARECWEESRGILGEKSELEGKISHAHCIGKIYPLFFMKVADPNQINDRHFRHQVYDKHCHMEKIEIAWVRSKDLFDAVRVENQNQYQMLINDSFEKIRYCFAKSIQEALKDPKESQILESLNQENCVSLISA